VDIGDTVKRIDGTEVPLTTPWVAKAEPATPATGAETEPKPGAGLPADATGITVQEAPAESTGSPVKPGVASGGTAVGEPGAPMHHPATDPVVARQPAALPSARDGKADDLKIIEGIGKKMEALCHQLGFFHFDQIAGWSAEEVAWVDENLQGFKGRVTRDRWVAQAKLIGEVGIDEFLRRAKTNDY